jgi:hypothetical protein
MFTFRASCMRMASGNRNFDTVGQVITHAGLKSLAWAGNGLQAAPAVLLTNLASLTELDLSVNRLMDFTLSGAEGDSFCLSPLEARLQQELTKNGKLICMAALNELHFPELENEASFDSALLIVGRRLYL